MEKINLDHESFTEDAKKFINDNPDLKEGLVSLLNCDPIALHIEGIDLVADIDLNNPNDVDERLRLNRTYVDKRVRNHLKKLKIETMTQNMLILSEIYDAKITLSGLLQVDDEQSDQYRNTEYVKDLIAHYKSLSSEYITNLQLLQNIEDSIVMVNNIVLVLDEMIANSDDK